MDNKYLNSLLFQGITDDVGLFPSLDKLKKAPFVFNVSFGLDKLPTDSGILLIRGPRQYGKSTWLEQEVCNTIKEFGPGTAFYLNGEDIADRNGLEKEIDDLLALFPKNAAIRRIFIDEITAIKKWELALKKMADRGKLHDVLIITTGSKATDLRRGSEKLPGRKGKLARTNYLFTPISFYEFKRVCGSILKSNIVPAYLLAGGSPIACATLATEKIIPEYVIELTRDWIEGEIAFSGRDRTALFNILSSLFRFGGTPLGQAKLAREAGLANNTVAVGYIEILNDLGCVTPAYPWDLNKKILILRKECKYHFTNLLTAISYHPARIRTIDDLLSFSPQEQGIWYEWLIAQELQRRRALDGLPILTPLGFWQTKQHEIDFFELPNQFVEVKRGQVSPMEFLWFSKQFPNQTLTIVNSKNFETANLKGMTIEDFLLERT